jgi:hypothetical protein
MPLAPLPANLVQALSSPALLDLSKKMSALSVATRQLQTIQVPTLPAFKVQTLPVLDLPPTVRRFFDIETLAPGLASSLQKIARNLFGPIDQANVRPCAREVAPKDERRPDVSISSDGVIQYGQFSYTAKGDYLPWVMKALLEKPNQRIALCSHPRNGTNPDGPRKAILRLPSWLRDAIETNGHKGTMFVPENLPDV